MFIRKLIEEKRASLRFRIDSVNGWRDGSEAEHRAGHKLAEKMAGRKLAYIDAAAREARAERDERIGNKHAHEIVLLENIERTLVGSGNQPASAERAGHRTGAQRDPHPASTRSAASLVPSVQPDVSNRKLQVSLVPSVGVERLRSRVIGWAGDVCDQFYNPRGCGQCSTCGALQSDHEPAKRLREDVDALIAAVRAECQRIEKKDFSAGLIHQPIPDMAGTEPRPTDEEFAATMRRMRIIRAGAGWCEFTHKHDNSKAALSAAREALTVAMEYLARPKRIADHDNWPYDDLERLIADLVGSASVVEGEASGSANRSEAQKSSSQSGTNSDLP